MSTTDRHVLRAEFAVAFDYPVHFTRGVFRPENTILCDVLDRRDEAKKHRVAVVLDAGLVERRPDLPGAVAAYAAAHAGVLDLVGEPELVPGGESAKNDAALVDTLHRSLSRLAIDRHSFLIAVGGGAVLDLAGFSAATFHRGVRHVRVPTTVLSQNDSGIGVKNGINALGVKNLVGTFAPPWAVVNDIEFLPSLHPRDARAGIAEAVKVALIRDRAFFEWIESATPALASFEEGATARMIRRCAELHMNQIMGVDPFESGTARPLDFGHWAAHRLEALTDYRLRHGEAVAIGMALDTQYSVMQGLLSTEEGERVLAVLEGLGLAIWDPALQALELDGEPAVLRGLSDFREHLGGRLTVTLLAEIGRGVEVHTIDTELVMRAGDQLKRRGGAA